MNKHVVDGEMLREFIQHEYDYKMVLMGNLLECARTTDQIEQALQSKEKIKKAYTITAKAFNVTLDLS